MSAITAVLTFICLVDLHNSAQGLQAAESTGKQDELLGHKFPQISLGLEGSSRSNYVQGGYSGTSYGVGGSGRSGSVGSSYHGGEEYGRPGYGQFGQSSSNGYGKGEGYSHGSYGVGNYDKGCLSNGGYKQSTHHSYGGDGNFVGASHVKNDSPASELSIKGIAKEYLINFLTNVIRGKDRSGSAAENVGSAQLSDYQSYEAPVIPVSRGLYSYPLITPQVKYGSRLLISCTPSCHVAPCPSYRMPSYGRY